MQVIITDAASWRAVERKARLAGNGLRPCSEAQTPRAAAFRRDPERLQLRATARSLDGEHPSNALS